jgi:hypothetical protein
MEINIYIIITIIIVLICITYYIMTQQENFKEKNLLRIKAKINQEF